MTLFSFPRMMRLALPALAALVTLAGAPGLASAQPVQPIQRRHGAPLGAEQRAELRRDVVDGQSNMAEPPAKGPRERRLSPEQRAELRRLLREQAGSAVKAP